MRMTTNSILRSRLEERQWITRISELLEKDDLQTAIESPAFIFQVPDCIRNANPNAYLPRRIALGPLHHFRPEFYKLQFYKLHMAKMAILDLQLPDLNQLHNQLKQLELRIRASFDTYLEIGSDTLVWMMLVDSLFLLRVLANVSTEVRDHQYHMLDFPKFLDQNLFSSLDPELAAQYLIPSDVLKLENQIPLLVIKGILSNNLSVKLPVLLYHFCQSVSPFYLPSLTIYETYSDIPNFIVGPNFYAILDHSHHLLHFTYFSILITPACYKARVYNDKISLPVHSFLQKSLSVMRSVLNIAFIPLCEAVGFIMELLQLLGMVKKQYSDHKTAPPPLIPSASQLQKVHIHFKESSYGILGTKFIKDSAVLFLPHMKVNAFTETLLENLAALESMAKIDPSAVARYIELMKALIATPKDLKIVKDYSRIIHSDLKNDGEVLMLFNGVGSSISTLNNKPSLEKLSHLRRSKELTSGSKIELFRENQEIKEIYEDGLKGIIEEINQYYESCWQVKAERFVKKYVGCAVEIFVVLVLVFLVVLIFLVVTRLITSALRLLKTSVAEEW